MSDAPPEDDHPEEPDHTPDLTDRRSIRRTRDRQLQEQREREAFWKAVLADKVGRREVWRLIADMDWGHAFNTKHAATPVGFPDERASWEYLGQQQMALRLYHELMAIDPQGIVKLHEEFDPRFVKKERRHR